MQCLKADSVEINFQDGQQLFQLNFRDIDFLLLERIALFVGPSLTKFAALYVARTHTCYQTQIGVMGGVYQDLKKVLQNIWTAP